jgi:hypothetical protein
VKRKGNEIGNIKGTSIFGVLFNLIWLAFFKKIMKI